MHNASLNLGIEQIWVLLVKYFDESKFTLEYRTEKRMSLIDSVLALCRKVTFHDHVITFHNMEPTDVLNFFLGRLIDLKNTCRLFSVN